MPDSHLRCTALLADSQDRGTLTAHPPSRRQSSTAPRGSGTPVRHPRLSDDRAVPIAYNTRVRVHPGASGREMGKRRAMAGWPTGSRASLGRHRREMGTVPRGMGTVPRRCVPGDCTHFRRQGPRTAGAVRPVPWFAASSRAPASKVEPQPRSRFLSGGPWLRQTAPQTTPPARTPRTPAVHGITPPSLGGVAWVTNRWSSFWTPTSCCTSGRCGRSTGWPSPCARRGNHPSP